jgi:hypothetical protein
MNATTRTARRAEAPALAAEASPLPDLPTILSLRPGPDADSAAIRASIARGEAMRDAARVRAEEAEGLRGDPAALLTVDDAALAAAERDAAAARRAGDRIDLVLQEMQQDLETATARETHAALQAEAADVTRAIEAMRAWIEGDDYAQLRRLLGRGLRLEKEAVAKRSAFLARVDAEYRRSLALRAIGALGADLPDLPPEGSRPTGLFPGWRA